MSHDVHGWDMNLTHTRLGARGNRWSTPRGTLEIRMPAADVVMRRFEGYATTELVEPALRHLEAVMASRMKPIIFDDFELGVGYESDVRMKLTAWHVRHVGEVEELHILVRPGLLAMGVSVVNLATGGRFTTYHDRSSFEWAFARVMATRLAIGPASSSRGPSPR
jgi:hypothetical protein